MAEELEKILDIDKILRNKMGEKSKRVPKFIVNWLRKIMHQDELNVFLNGAKGETGHVWMKDALRFLKNEIKVVGLENLPDDSDGRRFTFVSNHPLGGIDGIAIGSVIGEKYNDNFRYLVNDLLLNMPGLVSVSIPINKTGKSGRNFPAMVEAGFNSDHHMLMFPAGLCSRKTNGIIHDLPWKKTFIAKSIKTHRDVVPIYFEGQNSEKFYRIANICKALHLKVNIAMLFLSDEMFKNVGKTFTVTIGKPIPWQTFDKSKKPQEWAQWVCDRVYELKP